MSMRNNSRVNVTDLKSVLDACVEDESNEYRCEPCPQTAYQAIEQVVACVPLSAFIQKDSPEFFGRYCLLEGVSVCLQQIQTFGPDGYPIEPGEIENSPTEQVLKFKTKDLFWVRRSGPVGRFERLSDICEGLKLNDRQGSYQAISPAGSPEDRKCLSVDQSNTLYSKVLCFSEDLEVNLDFEPFEGFDPLTDFFLCAIVDRQALALEGGAPANLHDISCLPHKSDSTTLLPQQCFWANLRFDNESCGTTTAFSLVSTPLILPQLMFYEHNDGSITTGPSMTVTSICLRGERPGIAYTNERDHWLGSVRDEDRVRQMLDLEGLTADQPAPILANVDCVGRHLSRAALQLKPAVNASTGAITYVAPESVANFDRMTGVQTDSIESTKLVGDDPTGPVSLIPVSFAIASVVALPDGWWVAITRDGQLLAWTSSPSDKTSSNPSFPAPWVLSPTVSKFNASALWQKRHPGVPLDLVDGGSAQLSDFFVSVHAVGEGNAFWARTFSGEIHRFVLKVKRGKGMFESRATGKGYWNILSLFGSEAAQVAVAPYGTIIDELGAVTPVFVRGHDHRVYVSLQCKQVNEDALLGNLAVMPGLPQRLDKTWPALQSVVSFDRPSPLHRDAYRHMQSCLVGLYRTPETVSRANIFGNIKVEGEGAAGFYCFTDSTRRSNGRYSDSNKHILSLLDTLRGAGASLNSLVAACESLIEACNSGNDESNTRDRWLRKLTGETRVLLGTFSGYPDEDSALAALRLRRLLDVLESIEDAEDDLTASMQQTIEEDVAALYQFLSHVLEKVRLRLLAHTEWDVLPFFLSKGSVITAVKAAIDSAQKNTQQLPANLCSLRQLPYTLPFLKEVLSALQSPDVDVALESPGGDLKTSPCSMPHVSLVIFRRGCRDQPMRFYQAARSEYFTPSAQARVELRLDLDICRELQQLRANVEQFQDIKPSGGDYSAACLELCEFALHVRADGIRSVSGDAQSRQAVLDFACGKLEIASEGVEDAAFNRLCDEVESDVWAVGCSRLMHGVNVNSAWAPF